MSRAANSLKTSDVITTPIKLKYTSSYDFNSFGLYGITVVTGSNGPVTVTGSVPQDTINYYSVRHLYYSNYLTGSYPVSASSNFNYLQSTAASGTLDADVRYFPTESSAQVAVLSIPRGVFGQQISRHGFIMSSSAYYIVDDGNGNIIDQAANNTHVGNIIYPQGMVIFTNPDYAGICRPGIPTTTTSTTTTTTTSPDCALAGSIALPTTTTTSTTSTTTTQPTTTTTSTTTSTTTDPTTTTTSTTSTTTTDIPTTSTTTTTTTDVPTTSTTTTTTTQPATTTTSTTSTTTTDVPTTSTTTTTTTQPATTTTSTTSTTTTDVPTTSTTTTTTTQPTTTTTSTTTTTTTDVPTTSTTTTTTTDVPTTSTTTTTTTQPTTTTTSTTTSTTTCTPLPYSYALEYDTPSGLPTIIGFNTSNDACTLPTNTLTVYSTSNSFIVGAQLYYDICGTVPIKATPYSMSNPYYKYGTDYVTFELDGYTVRSIDPCVPPTTTTTTTTSTTSTTTTEPPTTTTTSTTSTTTTEPPTTTTTSTTSTTTTEPPPPPTTTTTIASYIYAGTTGTYADSTSACTNKTCGRPWYRSAPTFNNGDIIYDDNSLTVPYNGGGNWLAISTSTGTYCGGGWRAVQVDSNGVILDSVACP